MSLRDRIAVIGTAMLSGDPSPAQVREHEITLAGLLAAVNKAEVGAEIAFKRKLADLRAESASNADAKLYAEASVEYQDWRETISAQKSVMEMLRTCRSFGRGLSDEMRLQR
jgi:hypothetical protein